METNDQELQLNQQTSKSTEPELMPEAEPVKVSSTHERYVAILRQVLPHLGKDQDKIIHAQVMLALKLEGIIGKDLSKKDSKMVNIIKDAILSSDDKKENALLVAQRIISQN